MSENDMNEQEAKVSVEKKAAKPKTTRRRTTAAAAKGALVDESTASKKKTAPAKTTRKRTAKVAEDAPAEDLTAKAADASEAEAPAKPVRRGRKKATPAPASAVASKAPASAAAPKGEPARKAETGEARVGEANPARRGRKKAVAADASAEAPVASAEAPAKPAAEAPAKPAAEASAEPAAEAPAKPARRGRRRTITLAAPTEAPKDAEVSESAPRQQGHQHHASQGQDKAPAIRNGKGSNRQGAGQGGGKQGGSYDKRGQGAQGGHAGNGFRKQRRQYGNQQREIVPSVTLEDLAKLKVAELRAKAEELSVDAAGLKKAELVQAVYDASVKAEGFNEVAGVLDILQDGYGFLRTQGYLPSETDAYVGLATIRRNGLRKGDYVCGQTRPARENEKYAAIQKVISINGIPLEQCAYRPKFADLTPVYPDDRLWMEHGKQTITARVVDLVAPIGKGQRGLIVSPPKAGKTTILKDIAASISANNPEVHLMCLLVDERPEEVTDMERSVRGEVISSTFDMPCENHIAVAELVIERAKRLVEAGRDVVILMDSITRLARAYNLAQPASGRILSGGVDSTALYPPKRFLGAARNIEGGGSLTILASALIETGSKMDEVIFEEFKGTGNMELRLDRNLADRRIFPAIDPVASGTRKEELLLESQEAPLIWAVRRILANMNSTERAMGMLIKSLKQTETNQEFLIRTAKKAQHGKSDENFEL